MIIRTCAIALLLTVCHEAFAQEPGYYPFPVDDSVLARQYSAISKSKKEQLLKSTGREHAKDYKLIYESQFEDIDELWTSGRAITSTPINPYVQRIVQRILQGNAELAGNDARVVVSRDWWPNAVSMGDGSIAVNAGLITQLHNEAEIAFVICHELAHYYLEHTPKRIRTLVTLSNSDEFKSKVRRLSKEQYRVNEQYNQLFMDLSFNTHRHSRDNEAEADRYAVHFLKNSGYNADAANSCLKQLDQADDSLFASPLQLERVFNFTSYPFKPVWLKEESAIFSSLNTTGTAVTAGERDSLKTHPDCTMRIALLADSFQTTSTGRNFQVDSAYFVQLKKDLAMEIIEQCYRENYYSRNLYYSLAWLNGHPDDPIAVYNISRTLNELFDRQRDHRLGSTIDKEKRSYPLAYNKLLRMLNKIRLSELGDLAYYFARQYQPVMQGYPAFGHELNRAIRNKQ